MNTTHDDATTWRNLTDQLTPKQIAHLDLLERQGVEGSPGVTAGSG